MPLPPPSPAEHAWLTAIRATPDDLQLLTVFADWLEEQGQNDRAELVRYGCALEEVSASQPLPWNERVRATELEGKVRRELLHLVRPYGVQAVTVRKGILTGLDWPAEQFTEHAAELAQWAPAWHTSDIRATFGQLPKLAQCPQLAQLERLIVTRLPEDEPSPYGDAVAQQLAESKFVQGLRVLWLGRMEFTSRGLAYFGPAGHWQNLRELRLGYCNIAGSVEEGLRQIAHLPQLEDFNLWWTQCDDRELAAGLSAPGWQNLKSLSLPRTGASWETLAAIGNTAARPHLQSLNLAANQFPHEAWQALTRQAVWPGLKSINLSRSTLYAEEAAQLFAWLGGCPLEALRLERSLESAAGLTGLRGLRRPTLKLLNVAQCGLEADGVRRLANAAGLAQLRDLDLSDNRILWHGAEQLVRAPFWTTLQRLNLENNPLGDQGVIMLAAGRVPAGLRVLNLERCQITNHAAERLAQWPALAQLTELNLNGNQINDAGAAVLERAVRDLPGLRIALAGNPLSHEASARWV